MGRLLRAVALLFVRVWLGVRFRIGIQIRLRTSSGCGKQTSVTAGTIMHHSKLPLTTWFWAAYLMATHSNGISALQLQRQLALDR